MTLPKRLQEKRDELCELYKQECLDNWHSPGLYLKPDFNKGFEQACALLIPEIEKLREALRTKCMCYPSDDPRSGRNPCHACRTIQSWQEFLGSEE